MAYFIFQWETSIRIYTITALILRISTAHNAIDGTDFMVDSILPNHRRSRISWVCRHLNENAIFKLNEGWNGLRSRSSWKGDFFSESVPRSTQSRLTLLASRCLLPWSNEWSSTSSGHYVSAISTDAPWYPWKRHTIYLFGWHKSCLSSNPGGLPRACFELQHLSVSIPRICSFPRPGDSSK
jgi:hypothetical protein